jgi:trehalose 6-phosphate synthase
MNLVAKEFVAARNDNRGVLVLSEFAGAARELTDALIVNPYAIDDTAQTLARALTMPPHEQMRRMLRMRAIVARRNVSRWAAAIVEDASRLREAQSTLDEAWERRRVDVLSAP